MSQDQHIKNFSALDIERYHQGQLSPFEMNQMEKAALEDPFLADALEGYAIAGVDASHDLSELQKKLTARVTAEQEPKLVTMERPSFRWLKVAAMTICVVGAGLLVYQVGLNGETKKDIAQTSDNVSKQKEEPTIGPPKPVATKKNSDLSASGLLIDSVNKNSIASARKIHRATDEYKLKQEEESKDDNIKFAPAKPATTNNEIVTVEAKPLAEDKELKVVMKDQSEKEGIGNSRTQELAKQKAAAPQTSTGNAARQQASNSINLFSGRITDAQNNALPFANITNQADHIGTYSDVKGNFALTSPDTAMQVEIRSVGFTNSQIQLHAANTNLPAANQIILKEDHSSLAEVTISKAKRNSERMRENNNNLVLDDAEPADGWTNYDIYLVNNLKAPGRNETRQKNSGEVELSFEVDKNGEPTNITVVRSLCETCDKEAIRLLKDGPKWKKKKGKGRTLVTVAF